MGQYWRPEKGWWADGLGQAAPGPWLPTLPSAWLRGGWLVAGDWEAQGGRHGVGEGEAPILTLKGRGTWVDTHTQNRK